MRRRSVWLLGLVFSAGLAVGARPASAARPTCDDLLSALSLGNSREQVASDFGTTQARLTVCAEQAKHRERQSTRREHFQERRLERGLPLDGWW